MDMKQAVTHLLNAMPPGACSLRVTHDESIMVLRDARDMLSRRSPEVRFTYRVWFQLGDPSLAAQGYMVESDHLDGAVADALAVLRDLNAASTPAAHAAATAAAVPDDETDANGIAIEKIPDSCLPMQAIRAAGLETLD